MKYYLAPLEGITTYVYRRAVHDFFGDGVDKYFTPFFSPLTKRHLASRSIRDVLPENNEGFYLVPQMLTNDAEDFLKFERDMRAYGYDELNLNIGCPSGTVVGKFRGAGFLSKPDELDRFLDELYSKTNSKISVKTRLGMYDVDEFPGLVEIFNKYPIYELIIHARVGKEMYRGKAHKDIFKYAIDNCKMPICYNGDIYKTEDVGFLPENVNVMCGRGMIANPALIRELNGGPKASKEEVRAFLEKITNDYLERDPDHTHLLFKLKEIWSYMKDLFPGYDKEYKILLKSNKLEEYKITAEKILRD